MEIVADFKRYWDDQECCHGCGREPEDGAAGFAHSKAFPYRCQSAVCGSVRLRPVTVKLFIQEFPNHGIVHVFGQVKLHV